MSVLYSTEVKLWAPLPDGVTTVRTLPVSRRNHCQPLARDTPPEYKRSSFEKCHLNKSLSYNHRMFSTSQWILSMRSWPTNLKGREVIKQPTLELELTSKVSTEFVTTLVLHSLPTCQVLLAMLVEILEHIIPNSHHIIYNKDILLPYLGILLYKVIGPSKCSHLFFFPLSSIITRISFAIHFILVNWCIGRMIIFMSVVLICIKYLIVHQ